MGHYQQSDSLSTTTDVPFSGNGTSTPEGPAGNDDYSAWQWESVLATVLSIPIPDRNEVTGQSWLTISHDGQGGAGQHLIWTAGWDQSQNSGATSLEVYLNPALYTAGGAWDRFLNSPPQALSGVPSGDYAGLPLVPPSFEGASLVVASATNFWESAAAQLDVMHSNAISGPIGFQGNLASVVSDLLGHLRTVSVQLHQQLTEPASYSDSIEAAGGSATTFLADLLSAYSSWTQLAENSPLGAVVTVLEQIATPGANGGYVIPDPQNTRYGDLTIDSSWAAVEQQAKNLWAGTLTGDSGGFAGLDLLGRTALNKMISQFSSTTNVLVPVVGPAPPNLQPNPVNSEVNNNGNGNNSGNNLVSLPPPNGGGGTGPGSQPPSTLITSSGPGGPNSLGGPGGPGGFGGPGGVRFSTGGVPGGPVPVPPGGTLNSVTRPATSVLASGAPGSAAPAAGTFGGGSIFAVSTHGDSRLSSPAGAGRLANGSAGNPSADLGIPGFTGAIGRPAAAGGNEGRRHKGLAGRSGRGKEAFAAGSLTAPAAGFSLGRGPDGVVLERSAVPTIAARPPSVTSSVISIQPAQLPGGTMPATAGPPAGPPTAGTQVPAEGNSVLLGNGGGPGPEMAGATQAAGAGGTEFEGGLAMPPMGGMGMDGAGGAGRDLGRVERQRLSYLPEEPRYWGTEPGLITSLGTADDGDDSFGDESFDDSFTEQVFDAVPSRIAGIGARIETEHKENAATDWGIQ